MRRRSTQIGNRRIAVGAALGVAALAAAGRAGAAGPPLTLTPTSGAPDSTYEVRVDCAQFPELYRGNTQDAPVQGTVAPRGTDEVSELAPSTWVLHATAGRTDDAWYARCGNDESSSARFDAEAPHLWFGPRPRLFTQDPRTTVEGTDCPAGTTAEVRIGFEDVIITIGDVPIDQYGDWSVDLPRKVGDADLRVDASCGEVTYAQLTATSTSTSSSTTTSSTTTTAPPTPGPEPATPVRSSATFTG